jgi:hypothetical protein
MAVSSLTLCAQLVAHSIECISPLFRYSSGIPLLPDKFRYDGNATSSRDQKTTDLQSIVHLP